MRLHICVSVLGGLWLATMGPSALATQATTTIFVNCEVGPGGDGSHNAPINTITAAMAIARGMTGSPRLEIEVAQGVCDQETLPIVLDRTVRVRGARTPGVGPDGLPDGQQSTDTLVISPTPSSATFFRIAAADVEISRLSIDGQYIVQGDFPADDEQNPIGVSVTQQQGYTLRDLRIDRIAVAMRSDGSSGRVLNNYIAGARGPILSGGAAGNPSSVRIDGNRVVYRINGVTMIGGGNFGTLLSATVSDNDIRTSFTNTGATNPAGLRVSPILGMATNPPGTVDLTAADNTISGPAKYGIMLHGGQPVRNGTIYSGEIEARFTGTVFDPAVVNRALISFTNARATVLPCELNPNCAPPPISEYLRQSVFDLRHTGELDNPLIDHPELHPIDHNALQNRLRINKSTVGYETFVVVPASLARPAGLR